MVPEIEMWQFISFTSTAQSPPHYTNADMSEIFAIWMITLFPPSVRSNFSLEYPKGILYFNLISMLIRNLLGTSVWTCFLGYYSAYFLFFEPIKVRKRRWSHSSAVANALKMKCRS